METFDVELNSSKCLGYEINSENSAIVGGTIKDLKVPAVYFFELTFGTTIKKDGKVLR